MKPHLARLLIVSYGTAFFTASMLTPLDWGWGGALLAAWLGGPLIVLALAAMPRVAFAARLAEPLPDVAAVDRAWIEEETELRQWDRDLAADLSDQETAAPSNPSRRAG
ncbi:MAG: hypothetical protein AAFR79_07015 [Pseudomonadota bacterium]